MIYDLENTIADLIEAGYPVSTVTNSGEVQVKKITKDKDGKDIVDFEWIKNEKVDEIISRYSVPEPPTPDPLAEILKKLDDMNSRITAIEKRIK